MQKLEGRPLAGGSFVETRRGCDVVALLALAVASGCSQTGALPEEVGYGANPTLPPPHTSLVPTIDVAKARGWPGGIRGWLMQRMKKRAGGAVPSANRITLLRDADGDGNAELRTAFLEDLDSPFGMALVGDDFCVAIGSASNAAEAGIAKEEGRARILEIDPRGGSTRVFASGLRNPVGMDWQPETGALWTAVNERDELGADLVPDYMTAVVDGGLYGWPYSYYGRHVDGRVEPQRPDLVAQAIVPDYALGSHTASLGLGFYDGELLPRRYVGGAFVGQHGSWNREPPAGYKVIFVPFAHGRPSGGPEDVLTGFVNGDGEAFGRPVGVTVDAEGALLVADDVGNAVWRVTPSATPPTVAHEQETP